MICNIKELTLEEKIGQMIIIGLDTNISVKKLEDIINKHKVGGVLLYKKNYKSYEQMVDVINKIKELNRKNKIPMFISIDQEGGRVNRMPKEFKNFPSASNLAKKSEQEDFVKMAGEITGKMLNKLGINLNFAPVLDIKRFNDSHAIGDRAYSEKVDEVAKYGIEYMKSLQKNNIISIVKHFPGHGATEKDSHFSIPKIKCEIENLENEDMVPFKIAMKEQVDGILVGHLRISKVTGNVPASISKRFVTKYIRKKYRYNGLVITDDLRMKWMKFIYGKNNVIKKAFLASNDMILFKYDNDISVIEKIVRLAKENKIEAKRINRSVKRILTVKEKYNLNNEFIEKDNNFIDNINKEIEYVRKKVL